MSPIRISSLLIALAAAVTPFASQAQTTPARAAATAVSGHQLQVHDAWIRATVTGQQATGAFMQLQPSQAMTLVGARSPLTPVVEVHEMAVIDGVMKMRHLPELPLPAGQATALKPGGYHIMLMDLKQPIRSGETVTITLRMADGSTQEIRALARDFAGNQEDYQP